MVSTRWRLVLAGAAATLLLAACGGGGGSPAFVEQPLSCSTTDQKTWVRSYMDSEYFWYALMPNPNPAGYASSDTYFSALLSAGGTLGSSTFPADRWSYSQSTTSFNQFFGAGQTLGYGVSVNGLEVAGQPSAPLRVRYVELASPGYTAGIRRGDTLTTLNGVAAATYITNNDFSVLTPSAAGQTITLGVRNTGGDRTVTVAAAVYALTPVSDSRVVTSPNGTKIGYIVLRDFISQALTPLDTAFAQFKAQGVNEIVLDLRYNGGGLVSVARELASYAAGARATNGVFADLLYSNKRSANNTSFRYSSLTAAMNAPRVFVLSGPRTASASELVINGLEPFVTVVQIGDTTSGKPVGFVPEDGGCGTTYSAVNFESVNALNQGRYWNGLAPNCVVGENFDKALGDPTEPLLAAVRSYVDTGACPVSATREQPTAVRRALSTVNEGERSGMIGR